MRAENNLDTDNVRELVWRLAFPSMLAQFVSVFYSIVDRMYIGNIEGIGELALAGVGICGPIVTMISSIASWIGIGGSPLLSIRMGQKNEKAAEKILANCFCLLTGMAAVVMALSLLMKDKLLMWFGASENIFPYANDYITIYLLGTIFALLATGMNQFIICQGFAKTAMKSVLLGAVCNIILDPVFIFALNMDVKGAAVATVLSQLVSCIYVLKFLFGKVPPIRITFGGYQWNIMKRVLILGLTPFLIIAFDNILIISLNAVIQKYGGAERGDMLLTCNTILQSFMLMVTMPLGGITGGTQTILGFNYGAKRPDRIKKAEKHIFILAVSFTSIMFIAAQLIPQYFALIFTRNPEYIAMTVKSIRIYSLMIIPLAAQYTIVDGFTGMGISKMAISLSMFRKMLYFAGVFLIPVLFDITDVFYTEPVSDLISAIVSTIAYFMTIDKIIDPKRQNDNSW